MMNARPHLHRTVVGEESGSFSTEQDPLGTSGPCWVQLVWCACARRGVWHCVVTLNVLCVVLPCSGVAQWLCPWPVRDQSNRQDAAGWRQRHCARVAPGALLSNAGASCGHALHDVEEFPVIVET